MKAKCYVCGEKIDHHNKCMKRACRAGMKKHIKSLKLYSLHWDDWTTIDRTSRPRIPWINCD